MPNTGDFFVTTLKKAHLEWGTHRHTSSRGQVYGEGYLQIPKKVAMDLDIFNKHKQGANTVFRVSTSDGFLVNEELKASGNTIADDVYAKQFAGSGNLKLLGDWFAHINAQSDDQIKIEWTSPSDIMITKI